MQVNIFGSLQQATQGKAVVEVEAKNLRQLLNALEAKFPAMRPQLARGVSVAIDGRIYNDGWFTPIQQESEVTLLPQIVGG